MNGGGSYHVNSPKSGPILFFFNKDWISVVDNCRIEMIFSTKISFQPGACSHSAENRAEALDPENREEP